MEGRERHNRCGGCLSLGKSGIGMRVYFVEAGDVFI